MIAQRLKQLREYKKLSIKQVALAIRVSPSTYREWELGTKISGEPYLELAQLYQCSLGYLMYGEVDLTREDLSKKIHAIKNTLDDIYELVLSL